MGLKNKKSKKNFYDYLIYFIWLIIFIVGVLDLFEVPIRSISWFGSLIILVFIYYKLPQIPKQIYLLFSLLILANIFGEVVFRFCYKYEYYDKIVHLLSPLILCGFFYYLFENKIRNKNILLLLCVSLTLSIELIWEIQEYAIDGLFGTQMMGVYTHTADTLFEKIKGVNVLGVFDDTMIDMALGFLGSLFFVGGFFIRKKFTN